MYGCWRVERLPPIVGGFDPTEAFGLRMKDRLQWRKQVWRPEQRGHTLRVGYGLGRYENSSAFLC